MIVADIACAALGAVAAARELAQDDAGAREPGVWLRVFDLPQELDALPELDERRAPDVELVVPRVELFGSNAFGGVQDTFTSIVTGFLETGAGVLGLRLSSDDGSTLALDGRIVLENDGLHGHAGVETSVELAAGLHSFEIRHFDNTGAESLVLEWRPPGTYAFEVVPEAALSRPAGVPTRAPSAADDGASTEDDSASAARDRVHPSFALASIGPADFRPNVAGMGWSTGPRLVIASADAGDAQGAPGAARASVWVLDGVPDGAVRATPIAWGLAPRGLALEGGRIFVLEEHELTELVDANGDGAIDDERTVFAGFTDATGIVHAHGRLYVSFEHPPRSADGTADGAILRIDPATSLFEVLAQSSSARNALGIGEGGDVFVVQALAEPILRLVRLADTLLEPSEPDAPPMDFGATAPVVWFPRGTDGGRPSAPCVIPPGNGPYSGQMLLCDASGAWRVALETIDGVRQGSVHAFTRALEGFDVQSFGPHGVLYLGASAAARGLARLHFTGGPTFEMLAVRAFRNGLEVEFTEPIAAGWGFDPEMWELEAHSLAPTDESGAVEPTVERLLARSSTPSADRTRVFIEILELVPGRSLRVSIAHALRSESGRALWSDETWYTLNHLARGDGEALADPGATNALTDEEREAGWQLLFDGESLAAWRGFRRADAPDAPDGWAAVDGALTRVASAGELVTRETFEDFELSLEWRISRGADSGVFFHVSEEAGAAWETGPEMQIRDDATHPDGALSVTSAGGNYGLHAPAAESALPVGRYNHALLRVWDDRVEHWLNGVKVVDYDLGSADWEERRAASKFAGFPGYGRARSGHIALQDNGDFVAFRNIKIRRL